MFYEDRRNQRPLEVQWASPPLWVKVGEWDRTRATLGRHRVYNSRWARSLRPRAARAAARLRENLWCRWRVGLPSVSVSWPAQLIHPGTPFSRLLLFSARSANSLLAALASLTFARSNPKAELRSHSSGPVINSLNSKRVGLAFKDLTTTVLIHLSPVFLIPLHPFYPLPAKLSHLWALDLAFTWCKCPLVAAVDTALLIRPSSSTVLLIKSSCHLLPSEPMA